MLWGVAGVGYAVFAYRRQWRRVLGAAGWMTLALLPFIAVALVYNQRVTGSALALPNSAADPLDKFGFGQRRMMPAFDGASYGKRLAVESTVRNGSYLPLFLAGSYFGLVVAGVGLWLSRRRRSSLALLAIMLAFPVGYFVHWGTWVSSLVVRWGGPIYFVPLYGPLCILMATAVVAAWSHRRALGVALVVALVLGTLPALPRLAAARRLSVAQKPWKTSTATLKGRSLVFVAESGAYLMFYNPFSANSAKLDDRILYATDRGPANLDLIRQMPDRTAYVQRAALAHGDLSEPQTIPAKFPPFELQPREHPPVPIDHVDQGAGRQGPRCRHRSALP